MIAWRRRRSSQGLLFLITGSPRSLRSPDASPSRGIPAHPRRAPATRRFFAWLGGVWRRLQHPPPNWRRVEHKSRAMLIIIAPQPVIVSERRSREPNDLDGRSPPIVRGFPRFG